MLLYLRKALAARGKDIYYFYLDVLKPMQLLFHGMYERAKVDGSIRTDIPEEEMFITSSI